MKEIIWTKPELVAQIQFVEWTAENRLRHSKFLGLRRDKTAKDVRRET
jgi:ATP-dependent DNA ligase